MDQDQFTVSDDEVIQLIGICSKMTEFGLSHEFVAGVMRCGIDTSGIFCLACCWDESPDMTERQACEKDLQETVKDWLLVMEQEENFRRNGAV